MSKGKAKPEVTVAQGDRKGEDAEADCLVVSWRGWEINLTEDGFLKVEENGIERITKELKGASDD